MRSFPNGKNDDQVDALSRAFGEFVQPSNTGMLDYYQTLASKHA
jgi:phage terminase large subunit-like protein